MTLCLVHRSSFDEKQMDALHVRRFEGSGTCSMEMSSLRQRASMDGRICPRVARRALLPLAGGLIVGRPAGPFSCPLLSSASSGTGGSPCCSKGRYM